MNADEKEALRQEAIKSFEKFQEDDSLPTKKLRTSLRGIGFEPKNEDLKRLLAEFDKQETGFISKEDYLKIVDRKLNEKGANEEILKAFEMFDCRKVGKISFQDLKRVAEELSENILDEELHEMIREADKNNDTFVDKDEFLEIMKKTALY